MVAAGTYSAHDKRILFCGLAQHDGNAAMKNEEAGCLPFAGQSSGPAAIGRRGMLAQCGMGFGAVALAELLRTEQLRGSEREPLNPMQPRPAQLPSRVKHVIHLFMNGGPSHVDSFDPKPELQRRGGELLSGGI
jgi:hypothetical protein